MKSSHFEFSFFNKMWLILGIYKPPAKSELFFLYKVKITLNLYGKTFNNFRVIGDFNMSSINSNVKDFMNCLMNFLQII